MITLLAVIGLATSSYGAARMFCRIGQQIQSPFRRSLLEGLLTPFALVLGGIIGANWNDLSWGALAIAWLVTIAAGSLSVGINMARDRARAAALGKTAKTE